MLENKITRVCSPVDGELIAMEKVPDPVFSQNMMGEGFAIDPVNGRICSPIEGEVTVAFETGHAYGLKSPEGVEILVHFGLETVKLKGEGIQMKVKVGDRVQIGDVLCEVDIDVIRNKVPSLITPVVVTSGHQVILGKQGYVNVADQVMTVQ
jgi:glucose-specific phosphotransferase system IIA component